MSEDLVLGAVDARLEPEAIVVSVELVNRSDRTVHAYRASRGLGYEPASRTLRIRLTDRGSQADRKRGQLRPAAVHRRRPPRLDHDRAAPPAHDHPDRRCRRPRRAADRTGADPRSPRGSGRRRLERHALLPGPAPDEGPPRGTAAGLGTWPRKQPRLHQPRCQPNRSPPHRRLQYLSSRICSPSGAALRRPA